MGTAEKISKNTYNTVLVIDNKDLVLSRASFQSEKKVFSAAKFISFFVRFSLSIFLLFLEMRKCITLYFYFYTS